ncbi:hypothetical protein JO972_14025 [Verrucomicrobiaceae bacterium 5K15]|uniref:Uncharacterized protein n=1 Tax=Oceaniferula flava TaxID=2800421 RepID=A0AAE2SDA9_9BACT|nr:hypothetical protein [Oceaniferula flavus]MBK1856085.1 hypothetical protein [Oceaniferula flavus]MBM1137392.1 hypothetical protein [Oceaniferula flavus]
MKQQSPHHSTSGKPSENAIVPSDAAEEWNSTDPLWKLMDEASTPEPNAFFARNVLREVRHLEANNASGWKARLAAFFTPPKLVLGAAACAAAAFIALQMNPSSTPAAPAGSLAQQAPVELDTTLASNDSSAVSDLSALVIVETLDAAAEDPTIFTRDEVVAMLGL